jgi:hypothetical protein
MLTRTATTIVQVGMIAVAGGLVVAMLPDHEVAPSPAPAIAPGPGCAGWTAERLPALAIIDVAVRGSEVWLLTKRGVYLWDACTWRAHAPFSDLAGVIIDWETIDVDRVGAIVVTGESEAGPVVSRGWCGHGEPMFPAKRRRYRFVDGQTAWNEVEAPPRKAPEIEVSDRVLDTERTIIATSGDHAVIERKHLVGSPDSDGVVRGWGTVTSSELWRRSDNTWKPVLVPPPVPQSPARDRLADSIAPTLGIAVTAVGGSGPSDRWAVGYGSDAMPDIVQFDGTTWTSHRGRFRRDIQYHLRGVASSGPDDAWVIGEWGVVLHFDGLTWTELDKPSFVDVVDVTIAPDRVWVRDAGGGVFVRAR